MHRPGQPRQIGFTLIELAIVMVVAGLLLVPLLRMAGSAVVSTRVELTRSALEKASEALVSFAAVNGGCLPFAADDEGGLPDTDATGSAASAPDTGARKSGKNPKAGDLPWAVLGLTNDFLDGDGLRIQYFVASPYTDTNSNQNEITCEAGFKGFQWDNGVTYDAPTSGPLWVFDYIPAGSTDPDDRTLFEIKRNKSLPAGTHPNDPSVSSQISVYPNLLPDPLLEVRRGPDVTSATGSQDDVISSRNVFILIAPGRNRNADIGRLFIRDSTHTAAGGAAWTLGGINPVDDQLFSSEPNVDAGDAANNGDDTMLVMSFTRFKAEMGKHGLNMEPVCEDPC